MSTGYLYEPLPDAPDGLRLHLNEHTDGCSAGVLRALRGLTREQVARYPSYESATAACAAALGVTADRVLLTNGLDEGILAVSLAIVPRGGPAGDVVVVEPAYGLYGPAARLAAARVVSVDPPPDLSFSLERVLAAVGPATRLVVLSNPNNPSGQLAARDQLLGLLEGVSSDTTVFVDEAYVEFSGGTLIPDLDRFPNLIVGRTFAKAYGLAGLRIGCLVAAPDVVRRLRSAVAPFSVNICAVVALEAALKDAGYLAWYLHQVRQSRDVLYEGFTRLGLRFWRSDANFVLVHVPGAAEIRQRLAERGVHVRDRSGAPGCRDCLRVTAGMIDQARQCVDAFEEVLCAARC